MMVVCIELRIPLFVVGKPGSSKSLAKTVVADNMQGDAARSELFKAFKQVKNKQTRKSKSNNKTETYKQKSELRASWHKFPYSWYKCTLFHYIEVLRPGYVVGSGHAGGLLT